MKNIFPYVAGNTLGSHEKFIHKLKQRGANVVTRHEQSDVTLLFCPIVSRYETDVNAALSSAAETGCDGDVIVVAMHHTFDKNYPLASRRQPSSDSVILLVDCLFYHNQGLLDCSCNDEAVEKVCLKLDLKKTSCNRCADFCKCADCFTCAHCCTCAACGCSSSFFQCCNTE